MTGGVSKEKFEKNEQLQCQKVVIDRCQFLDLPSMCLFISFSYVLKTVLFQNNRLLETKLCITLTHLLESGNIFILN